MLDLALYIGKGQGWFGSLLCSLVYEAKRQRLIKGCNTRGLIKTEKYIRTLNFLWQRNNRLAKLTLDQWVMVCSTRRPHLISMFAFFLSSLDFRLAPIGCKLCFFLSLFFFQPLIGYTDVNFFNDKKKN